MCIVSGNRIVCTSHDEGTVKLYEDLGDKYFHFENVGVIREYKGQRIRPIGVTFSKKVNRIYIADSGNNRIIMTSTQLYAIQSIGSIGQGDEEFLACRFITCNQTNLFVSDFGNCRIQILTLQLSFIDAIKLDFRPEMLAVSESSLCVTGDDVFCFYDLNNKALRSRYECNFVRINYYNSWFYVFDYRVKTFFRFDNHGFLIDEIKANRLFTSPNADPYDGKFDFLKRSLIISCYGNNELIELKMNDDESELSEEEESENENDD